MEVAVWTAIAAVISAVLLLLGTRYTAQASKRASEYTAMLSAPDHISSGYDRLNEDMWTTIRDLRDRVTKLEAEAAVRDSKYRAALGYIRTLLTHIALHAPAPHVPLPPPELAEDVRVEGV